MLGSDLLFSRLSDEFCRRAFQGELRPDEGGAFPDNPLIMVVGTTATIGACLYCENPANNFYCQFSIYSTAPEVVSVDPTLITTIPGYHGYDLTYSAHAVGTASVQALGVTSHNQVIVIEPPPPAEPPAPSIAPPAAVFLLDPPSDDIGSYG
jgi:hypothetical protein